MRGQLFRRQSRAPMTQDRIIRYTTIVDLSVHAREVGPTSLTARNAPQSRLVLASHLVATGAVQESGQLRWQSLRTGRVRCQLADLSGTGQGRTVIARKVEKA